MTPRNGNFNRFTRPMLIALFWLLCAAILVFALRQVWPIIAWVLQVVSPFLIALIVAYVFHPIVTFVQHKLKLGRVVGILVLMISIALVFVGAIVWLAPVLYQQIAGSISDLSHSAPELVKRFARNLNPAARDAVTNFLQNFFNQINDAVKKIFTQMSAIQPVAEGSLTAVKSVAGGLVGGMRAVGLFLVTIVLVVVISFYYLVDMNAIPKAIRKLLPEAHREQVWRLLVQADRDVGGFLRGQLIACLIVGALTSILLFFVGLRQYAILIGCFAGIMHFIPYLGPIAGATPAVLWILMTAQMASWGERGLYLLIVAAGFTVIELIDGLFTQPTIVGKRARLHPLAVMLALAVGAQAGIGGMIIAVPTACFVRVLWLELFWKNRRDPLTEDRRELPPTPEQKDQAAAGKDILMTGEK